MIDEEESENREKNYRSVIKTKGVFNPKEITLFKIAQGNDGNFTCLGLPESSIADYEPYMINKLKSINKYISFELSEEYNVNDLLVELPVHAK